MNRRSSSSDADDAGRSAARSGNSQDVSEKSTATSSKSTGTLTSLKAGATTTSTSMAAASRSSIRTPLETHLSKIMSGSEFRNLKLVPDNARMPTRSFHTHMLRDLMDADKVSAEGGDTRATTTDRLVKSLSDQSLHGHARAKHLLRLQSSPTSLRKGETRWQSHEPLPLSSSATLPKASATSSASLTSSSSSLMSSNPTKRTSRSSNFARYKKSSSSALHRAFPMGTNPQQQQRQRRQQQRPDDFSFLDDHSETSDSQTSRTSATTASTVLASNATPTSPPGTIKEVPSSKNFSSSSTSTTSTTVRNPFYASSLSAIGGDLSPPLAAARWSSESTRVGESIFSLSPGETYGRRRMTASTGGVAAAAAAGVPRSTQSFPLTTTMLNNDMNTPIRPPSRQQMGPPRPPSRFKSSGSWSSNDGQCLEDEEDVNTSSSSNEKTSSSGYGDDEGSINSSSSSCDDTIDTDK